MFITPPLLIIFIEYFALRYHMASLKIYRQYRPIADFFAAISPVCCMYCPHGSFVLYAAFAYARRQYRLRRASLRRCSEAEVQRCFCAASRDIFITEAAG